MAQSTAGPEVIRAPRLTWFLLLALLGLGASLESTRVHYRMLNDPTYASFCDVSDTISCTQAYSSRFGSVAGVPVAVFGVVFFAFLLVLIGLCSRSATAVRNLPGYVFAASTIGLAVVLYLGYASFFILNAVCLLCLTTYIAVIGLFLLSGATTKEPMTSLPARALRDLGTLMRTPSALSATVAFAVAVVAAILFFRQPMAVAVSAESATAEQQAQPTAPAPPTATAAQIQQLEAYLAQRPRVPVMAPSDGAAVVIIKFNDYQCPACGQTYRDYKPVLAKWAKEAPGKVKFISRDYPLERECNNNLAQDIHPAACEAAVAVRLAREKGKAEAMEDWVFANQPALTPEGVKNALATIAGVKDFDQRFAGTLELVKADVAQGAQLKVKGTPTFFVNGMELPGLRPEFFDAAIAWELKRVNAGK